MKNIIIILIAGLLLTSCGATKNEEMPADLDGLKSMLIEKEAQLTSLKADIDSLKKSIENLDPEYRKKEVPIVETIELERADFHHFVEVQGSIEPGETKMVSSELPGKIITLNVKEGSRVKKGQLLATIDAESIKTSIEDLENSLELTRDLYERQKRLWEKNIGSEIQYLQAKNNVERLEKSLETAKISLKKARIYSPLTGIVARMMNKQGEIASPGMPLLQIIGTQVMKVNADVPEVYLTDVKRKDVVRVKIPVLEYDQEVPVYRVGQIINANNRTFEVEVRLKNPQNDLKTNLLAMIYINDYKAEDVVSVPLELVQQDVSGKNFVFVSDKSADDKLIVRKKLIETGIAYNGKIEVISGLDGTESLVSTGSQYLAEGDEIKVKQG